MNKLNYEFSEFVDGASIAGAYQQAYDFIIKLSPAQQALSKICASDQKDGAARVVIFHPHDASFGVFEGRLPSMDYYINEYKTPDDYEDLYSKVCSNLNSMPDFNAAYARVNFTNLHKEEATMAVWFPQI